jgi:hypothetical protein
MKSKKLRTITVQVDELDYEAIHRVIAEYQRSNRWPEGDTLVPEGEGDLGGRILAEVCRGYEEMLAWRPDA